MPYKLPNRQYPYPLTYLASDGGTVDKAFVANDPTVTGTEPNWFVWCLTPQEMVDVLSIFAVGAPIAFPDTYNTYNQMIMQLREFPNEIPEDTCMDLCQLIIDCIESTPALQQAIATYGNSSPVATDTTESQAGLDVDIIESQVGCDNDNIFGMTTGFTDLWNDLSVDLIQIALDATSLAGRLGDIIEAIPGIGVLPFDDIAQFGEAWLDDIVTAYDAAYTVALRNQIRCDLFCIATETCELTMEQIRDYFYDELNETVSFTDFGTFVSELVTLNLVGQATVWGIHLFLAQMMIYGESVFGLDFTKIYQVINSLFNDDDPDWATLCTNCVWQENWLNTYGTPTVDGWVIDTGTYQAGADEITEGVLSGSSNGVRVEYTFAMGDNDRLVQIELGYDVVTASDRTTYIQLFDDLGGTVFKEEIVLNGTQSGTLVWNGNEQIAENYILRLQTVRNSNFAGHSTMTHMEVKGSGDNPFN